MKFNNSKMRATSTGRYNTNPYDVQQMERVDIWKDRVVGWLLEHYMDVHSKLAFLDYKVSQNTLMLERIYNNGDKQWHDTVNVRPRMPGFRYILEWRHTILAYTKGGHAEHITTGYDELDALLEDMVKAYESQTPDQ